MPKRRDRDRTEKLFANLQQTTTKGCQPELIATEDDTINLTTIDKQSIRIIADSSKIPRLKKFRIQLLHQWLIHNLEPCKAADIGGGKGLLSYLLNKSGWSATVIDPFPQPLPDKYKDISTDRRVKIDPQESVPYIPSEFNSTLASQFDILIGMHAHGCNVKIIDASSEYDCSFMLFPCCIIAEPFIPAPGVHWLESLANYSVENGLEIHPFRLNFKGQNIGIFHPSKLVHFIQ
jgi:hypothetical protein